MLDLIAVKLNDPEKILPYPTYPSGAFPEDLPIYKLAKPNTPHPILRMPFPIYDVNGDCLPEGFYEVMLRPDRKMLFLIQSNRLKAKVPVIKLVEKPFDYYKELENAKKEEKEAKKRKKTNKKDTSQLKQQAVLKAELEESEDGSYVLKYDDGRIQAWGYLY